MNLTANLQESYPAHDHRDISTELMAYKLTFINTTELWLISQYQLLLFHELMIKLLEVGKHRET
jgi:hypothetical protein